jgi:hypothetical protein
VKFALTVFACVIVAVSPCAGPLAAQAPKATKRKPVRRPLKTQAKVQPSGSSARQQASIDPQTGELREGTPLDSAIAASSVTPATVITTASDGSVTAVLGPEHMSYTVLTVNRDGTVSQTHATAAEIEKNFGKKPQKAPK